MTDDAVRSGLPAVETGDEPPTPRIVAPGGWRRMLVGFALGTLAGALAGLVLPRDRRRARDRSRRR
ncbi:MAG: hypothetical protein ACRDUY_15070 [Nitriliruptorales bacterium]